MNTFDQESFKVLVDEYMRERYARNRRLVGAALDRRAAGGDITCAAPLGYGNKLVRGERKVVVDWTPALLIREAFELAATGEYSLRGLLQVMTRKGLWSRKGKPLGISSFWNILTNPFYTGMLRYKGELVRGNHIGIVTPELFEQAKRRLSR